MRKYDSNRVKFFSKEDMAGGYHLSNAENILKDAIKSTYDDINDVIELYNIKQYFDNGLYLKNWTQDDINNFKKKTEEYCNIVGKFMSKVNDSNVVFYYEQLLQGYINSFWELVSNQKIYKQISIEKFTIILSNEPDILWDILTHKNLVNYYDATLKGFLLEYIKSAEILLSIYEEEKGFRDKEMFLPKSLTIQDKENIVSKYLDSNYVNLNYIKLIKDSRKHKDFIVSDKIRLKANKKESEEIFKGGYDNTFKYSVQVSFVKNAIEVKKENIENSIANYSYSLDFIKQNNDNYSLFKNFKILFDYIDSQNRINLINKKSQMAVMECILGVHSQNHYEKGIVFDISEITSLAQITSYNKIINDLGNSLENILKLIFTSIFQEKYNFANNARFSMPPVGISYFEKVRLLAPEFESALKQYKLFVENNEIDFDLLQISSSPCAIKDIPSLIKDKYIYLDNSNRDIVSCSNLFFSNQTLLGYVEPYKENNYHTFFDILANEQVNFNNYEEHQKSKINYLIEHKFIAIDENGFIQVTNRERILILRDLYNNEVASLYHYPVNFQEEVKQMNVQRMIFFENSLFSKPEQNYFNYYLNKSEFTNGLDLRNSYLHGTQANPEEYQEHEYAYFTYLKLLVLALLKIEDDLITHVK